MKTHFQSKSQIRGRTTTFQIIDDPVQVAREPIHWSEIFLCSFIGFAIVMAGVIVGA